MGHDHGLQDAEAMDAKLWVTLGLNVTITTAEFIGAFVSGSVSLLSDATHNLSDATAIGLALVARRFSRRPATERHTYGFKRIEVIAALVNALTLVGVSVLIGHEAILRLLDPEPVTQGIMLVVALVALSANLASVFMLRTHDKDDVNMRGAFLHMAQDAAASLAVVIAALFANTSAGPYIDSIAALIVSIAVLKSVTSLVWQTLSTLLEGVPKGVELVELVEGVHREVAPHTMHHVHVWEIGPGQRLLTAHLSLGEELTMPETEAVLAQVREFLHEHWGIAHATIEPEVIGCESRGLLGAWQDGHDD